VPGSCVVASVSTFLILSLAATIAIAPAAAQGRAPQAQSVITPPPGEDNAARQRHALRERENAGLVGFIGGDIGSTDLRTATDLATVIDGAEQDLHVLPLVGNDAIQNAKDIAVTRGVDVGIIQADVLEHLRREPFFPGLENYLQYVTKLYDEEVHILARKEVTAVEDLVGRKVNIDRPGSGAAITAAAIFEARHLAVEPTHFDPALALEKLKAGEIAALVYVSGKPAPLFVGLGPDDNLHFLPLSTTGLAKTYSPAALTFRDYPGLIDEENRVDTVAVSAVLMAYNWPPGSERFRRVVHFVDAFFDHLKDLQEPPRHPKWHHIDLAAPVPGWTRFAPAEKRVRSAALAPPASSPIEATHDQGEALFMEFVAFLDRRGGGRATAKPATLDATQREALFHDFDAWRKRTIPPLDPQQREVIFWEFAAWRKAATEGALR
jgi:uncharacterized protein